MSKAQKAKARREEALGRRRRRWIGVAGGVVLLAALGVFVWGFSARDSGSTEAEQPVDHFMHVHGLEVPPWAPDDVYLATHVGLIRIDAAGEWSYTGDERHDFMGFSAHHGADGVLYSSGHPAEDSDLKNPLGFMVSTDHGATWEVRALHGETDFHAMTVAPGDGDVIYGYNASGDPGLYVSTDAGHSWDVVAADLLDQAGGALSLAVHPGDSAHVWAGTQAGLLVSADGGQSWERQLNDVVTAVAVDLADPDRLVAYTPVGDGLVESRDGGESWTGLGLFLGDDAAGHIAIHPEDPATLYVGSHGEGLWRTDDGGVTWETMAQGGVPSR